ALTFGNQTVAGSYTVLAIDAVSGCSRQMSSSVSVSVTNCRVGAEELGVSQVEGVEGDWAMLLPNPVVIHRAELRVLGQRGKEVSWKLIDLRGNAVLGDIFMPNSDNHREAIEVKGVSVGTYILQVSSEQKQANIKVIKGN
ncbi:MAG: T9SS type A sorting domain-containing protein, partial [Runella sp.]